MLIRKRSTKKRVNQCDCEIKEACMCMLLSWKPEKIMNLHISPQSRIRARTRKFHLPSVLLELAAKQRHFIGLLTLWKFLLLNGLGPKKRRNTPRTRKWAGVWATLLSKSSFKYWAAKAFSLLFFKFCVC